MPLKKHTQAGTLDDNAFFLQFYKENKGFLYFLAQKYTDNSSDCEDVVQESVIRLLKNIHTLRDLDRNRLFKYMALTVRSAFLDHQRKKHPELVISMDDLEVIMRDEPASSQPDDPVAIHLEVLVLKQSLSPRDWMILEGRYILGYTYEELSEQTGLTQENIRMIVSRAKEKARRLLLNDSEKEVDANAR